MALRSSLMQGLLMAVAWLGMLYFQQDSMIYHVRPYKQSLAVEAGPFEEHFDTEPLSFATEDGDQQALLLRRERTSANATRRLFLVFGGNAMLARDWFHIFDAIPGVLRQDTALVLVDYPGFGSSGGSPSRASIVRTGKQALVEAHAFIADQPGNQGEEVEVTVGAIGHSIGCAAAFAVAVEQMDQGAPLQHLVLSAPFTSLVDMAQSMLWVLRILPAQLIAQLVARHAWDNIADGALLAGSAAPRVDIIHGVRDSIVPQAMGKSLSEHLRALGMEATFQSADADHNDLLGTGEYADWLEGVLS